jgi:tetratricopeptide (TPR) repeat protein
MNNAGRPRASVDSAAAAAYRHRDRLPESRRDYIVGYYYYSGPGRDRAKAIEAYEAMLRRGDTANPALNPANNLALALTTRRQFARAESLFAAAARIYPDPWIVHNNLSEIQVRLQKFADAESTVAASVVRWPDVANFKRTRLNALYLKGDTGTYRRNLDSLYKNDSLLKGLARNRLADLALLHGRLAEWRRLRGETRPDSASMTPGQRLNAVLNDAIEMIVLEKRPADFAKRLDDALTAYPIKSQPIAERQHFSIANTYAWAGKGDKARAILAQYDADVRDTTQLRAQLPQRTFSHALTLMADHKPADAIPELRRADRLPDGPVDACVICISIDLARAFDEAGMIDSAIVHYDRAINDYASERVTQGIDAIIRAPYARRLGELYEQKGDHAKAVQYYRMFTELWKNADPELQPQVAEIRRRLARLSDIETKR